MHDQHQDAVVDGSAFTRDILAGLSAPQKALPSKYLYDERGSMLFDAICALPEYYPTRTERALLTRFGPEIGAALGEGVALAEFGAGSLEKIRLLLPHLQSPSAYIPIDISGDYLERVAEALRQEWPSLNIRPLVGDFSRPLEASRFDAPPAVPRAGFFAGSTIGNFMPDAASNLLSNFARFLGPEALLLIGVDLLKPQSILIPAYDDADGVTAAFNLNLLARINREAGADFNPEAFQHRALFNETESRVEMHLVSTIKQSVTIAGQLIDFSAGETIHTENSYKYSEDVFARLAEGGGFSRLQHWQDDEGLFSLQLLKVR